MKLNNIRDFPTIDAYVIDKLSRYSREDHTLETLYTYMFDEPSNIMTEITDGYRIQRITYAEAQARIEAVASTVQNVLADVPVGSLIGLYAQNSPDWITLFWSVLKCGYNILLLNTRLSEDILETVIRQHGVTAVISDGPVFSVSTHSVLDLTAPTEGGFKPVPFGREVNFMSSGTSDHVKLCTYTGENFYHQVRDSVDIIKTCPAIKEHYEGQLKHLVLLPFCHVFGFIAVYLWFGFFSRTFVFPRNLDPATVQNTIKKHKVTHIFAVPMVFEAVRKAAVRRIQARGDKTYRKFTRAVDMVSKLGKSGDVIAKKALREVRDGLFGDSIRFLISGGSFISSETLKFFNGIGYHLANGYGMTELGITSVERSSSRKTLNSVTVGAPFGMTEYRVSEEGELLVRSKTRATRISMGDKTRETNFDEWFHTGDLAEERDGRYYIKGRRDDLIVGPDGENINPVLAEAAISVRGAEQVCLFRDMDGNAILLASVQGIYSAETLRAIHAELTASLEPLKLSRAVRRVLLTDKPLVQGGEIKISRTRIAKAVASGEIPTFDACGIDRCVEEKLTGLEAEVRECFAVALNRPSAEIPLHAHFFTELGGTSLEYFSLLGEIKARFGVDNVFAEGQSLFSIHDFTAFIKCL